MPETTSPLQNHLLAGLPAEDQRRLFPKLELVTLLLGESLYEPGDVMRNVIFPTDSIVSLLYQNEAGASAEVSVIGNDGVIGVSLFMGGESTPSRAVVQCGGNAYQLAGQKLRDEFNRNGALEHLLLGYTQTLITQMSHTLVCNRYHTINQQLSRWLLLSLDRLQGNSLDMTQELIAHMLGVSCEGVTEAACRLQRQGVIKYTRGKITVVDRHKLEKLSCECYEVIKNESERMFNHRCLHATGSSRMHAAVA